MSNSDSWNKGGCEICGDFSAQLYDMLYKSSHVYLCRKHVRELDEFLIPHSLRHELVRANSEGLAMDSWLRGGKATEDDREKYVVLLKDLDDQKVLMHCVVWEWIDEQRKQSKESKNAKTT